LDTVRAEVDAWESEVGVEYIILRIRMRGLPSHRLAVEQLLAFGEQVIGPRKSTRGPAKSVVA
jgi:hypothetical protein